MRAIARAATCHIDERVDGVFGVPTSRRAFESA